MKNKKTGSTITTVILLAICIVLAAAIIYKMFQPEEDISLMRGTGTATASASNVYTQIIEPTEFVDTVLFYGTVSDDSDELGIITRAAGYVSEILVEEDEKVEEGQVIGYIDPSSPGASYQKSPVVARVAGTIDTINVAVGEYVANGSVFATEKEAPEYIVVADIPEKYLDNIHLGSKAYITSTVRSSVDTTAVISDISSKVNTTTRTVSVEMTPADVSGLLDGFVVTVNLVTEEESGVFSIPTNAISTIADKTYVYIAENGVATQREVTVGLNNDTNSVITSGLSLGDEVIVEGTVSNGAAINIVER